MASQRIIDLVNSSAGVKPATPVAQPIQTQTPVQQKTYNPVQTLKTNVQKQVDTAKAGLGVAADIISRPLYAFGSGLKGGYEGAEKEKTISGWAKGAATGAWKGLTGEEKVTPGKYLTETVLKDKVQNPYAKAGIEFGTDIVADPLNALAFSGVRKGIGTALSPIKKGIKAIKKSEPAQKIVEFARKTPAIYKPIEAIVDPYFRNPEAGKIIETTKQAIRSRTSQLYRYVDEAQKGLSSSEKARIGQLLEGGIPTPGTDKKLIDIANRFRQMGEDIGAESVKTGLLSPESFADLKGNYMHHMWDIVSNPDAAKKFGYTAADLPKIEFGPFKKRTGAEGYVREFQAPTFQGLGTEIRSNEAARMYQNIAKKFGKTPTTAEEMAQLAEKGYKYAEDITKTKGGQVLNKTVLPQEIIDYVTRYQGSAKTEAGKVYDAAMNLWKQGKTVWNPAYHVRNFLSNQILTDLQTGKGIPATLIDWFDATKKYMGKGNQQFVQEAQDVGLIKHKYFGEATQEFLGNAFQKESLLKKLVRKPSELQSFMEETAKLNVFSEMRKRGNTVEEAMKLAEEAIFSPYRISQMERSTLGRAIPFYSFTRQALPFIAKKLVTHPERFSKYIKAERAMKTASNREDKYLPDYMKEMIATPLKNKEGQPYYFNPQYIYPWGNFLQENSQLPFGYSMHPFLNELYAQQTKIDPYFKSEFVREGMPMNEQIKARAKHLATTVSPSFISSLANKIIPAAMGKKDTQGRTRSLPVTLAGELAGLKLYPYDEKAGKKSLETQKYYIQKDANTEINKIKKDQSLSLEEKKKKIQSIQQRAAERLQELK